MEATKKHFRVTRQDAIFIMVISSIAWTLYNYFDFLERKSKVFDKIIFDIDLTAWEQAYFLRMRNIAGKYEEDKKKELAQIIKNKLADAQETAMVFSFISNVAQIIIPIPGVNYALQFLAGAARDNWQYIDGAWVEIPKEAL